MDHRHAQSCPRSGPPAGHRRALDRARLRPFASPVRRSAGRRLGPESCDGGCRSFGQGTARIGRYDRCQCGNRDVDLRPPSGRERGHRTSARASPGGGGPPQDRGGEGVFQRKMNRSFFGTDGIRGPYGGPVVNEAFATRLGAAVGRWLGARSPMRPSPIGVLIGWDTRRSGRSLADAVALGLASEGWLSVALGVVPTPAIARAVRGSGAVLGVVITASHNPASDNGFKLFDGDGRKLTDAEEAEIEERLPGPAEAIGPSAGSGGVSRKTAMREGPDLYSGPDCAADYIAAARAILPPGVLRGWRIALD